MSTPLNLGFTRPTNCSLHDAVLTAHQDGLEASGYVRHIWRCKHGCAIPLTNAEEQRWGWQFFNKTSQLLNEQKEERTHSFEDIVAMLESEGLEIITEESGAQSSFGDDGPVTRITLGKKPPQ